MGLYDPEAPPGRASDPTTFTVATDFAQAPGMEACWTAEPQGIHPCVTVGSIV
jgi:hypothetical protein